MNKPSDISNLNQNRISQLQTMADHTITFEEAAIILKMTSLKLLRRPRQTMKNA